MDYKMLVNRDNEVKGIDEIISNLIKINIRSKAHVDPTYECLLNEETYNNFLILVKEANKIGFDIDIDSGYRSIEYQQKVLDYWISKKGDDAYKTVALPKHSEHHTGLAIDICVFRGDEYFCVIDDSLEEVKWIINNAYKFGFIHRYPKNKEDITKFSYEPWHIRYVGLELSMYLYENNLALEEYYNN